MKQEINQCEEKFLQAFRTSNVNVIEDCVEREIQLFEDTAIVTTVIYLKASSGGHLVEGKTRFLRTWKKFNTGWKIIGVASVNLG